MVFSSDQPLSEQEQKLFAFISAREKKTGEAPSYEEMGRAMGWNSLGTVYQYVKRLALKKKIKLGGAASKRSLKVIHAHRKGIHTLSLFGNISAGPMKEADSDPTEFIDVPEWVLPSPGGEYGCLRVKGSSMKDKGIFDGDVIVFRKQETAKSGQVVVASLDGQFTLKEFALTIEGVELRPYNKELKTVVIRKDQENAETFQILGVHCGVIRKIDL